MTMKNVTISMEEALAARAEDDRAPEEPPLRAVIAFRWSPEFTVFSLRGGPPDSFDGIVDDAEVEVMRL